MFWIQLYPQILKIHKLVHDFAWNFISYYGQLVVTHSNCLRGLCGYDDCNAGWSQHVIYQPGCQVVKRSIEPVFIRMHMQPATCHHLPDFRKAETFSFNPECCRFRRVVENWRDFAFPNSTVYVLCVSLKTIILRNFIKQSFHSRNDFF